MSATKIQWTDVTWNCVRGCSLVSHGCRECYAMKQAHRFSGDGKPYEGLTELGPNGPRWTGKVRTVPDRLGDPLKWRKPRRVFVNSMSDLFHRDVPDEFIDRVFAVMALTPQHTYQVLTKRPERMREYLANPWSRVNIGDRVGNMMEDGDNAQDAFATGPWPLPNVWLGVSCEDQKTADERIPHLLQTPAAVRFVSAEPLLGPVNLEVGRTIGAEDVGDEDDAYGAPLGGVNGIDWVIVGGESGPNARPCDLDWIRSIVEQCQAVGVPPFVKQAGSNPYQARDLVQRDAGIIKGGGPVLPIKLKDRKGGDPEEWPEDLRIREFPA